MRARSRLQGLVLAAVLVAASGAALAASASGHSGAGRNSGGNSRKFEVTTPAQPTSQLQSTSEPGVAGESSGAHEPQQLE